MRYYIIASKPSKPNLFVDVDSERIGIVVDKFIDNGYTVNTTTKEACYRDSVTTNLVIVNREQTDFIIPFNEQTIS